MPLQRSGKETLCGSQIAPLAEQELDGVTNTVNGSIEICPLTWDFDLSLIHVPFASDGSLV